MIPVMKPWLGPDEAAAAAEAVNSGWVAQGPRVAEFERRLAAKVGAAHGVAVSSCTAGLHLALLALNIGPGDEVIVPSLSFIATANVVRQAGALPVFADVDLMSQNLTADSIEARVTSKTKAVIAVHQVGMPADIGAIAKVCTAAGIELIEDAACAIGSWFRDRPIGSHSRLVVFSFHPRKILTTGEGGMVMTTDEQLADRIRRLRQHGMTVGAYERHSSAGPVVEAYLESGWNYRMTDIQAAVGLVQLDKLDEMIARRRLQAERYRSALSEVETLATPHDPPYGRTNFQSYVLRLEENHPESVAQLIARLEANGISPRRGVMAAHLEPAFAGHPHEPLPNTEHLTRQTIILPMYHTLSDDEQDRVIDQVLDR